MKKFTAQDCFTRTLDYALCFHPFSRKAIKINNDYYCQNNGILIPLNCEPYHWTDGEKMVYDAAMLYWIYQNAEQMRWTIIDETIPLAAPKIPKAKRLNRVRFDIFDGGRRMNALALGILHYWPALPELREAMMHDYDYYMRSLCVYAIGEMEAKSYGYKKDIRQCILDFDNSYFRGEAIKVLVKLKDYEIVPLLRDLFEEMRYRINQISFEEMFHDKNGYLLLLEDILEALIKLDINTARELLAISFADCNPHIYHFAKRAFALSKDRVQMKLMDNHDSILIGFLPKDPRWIFSSRPQ